MNQDKTRIYRAKCESSEDAIARVMNALGCSRSKAEKIAWGTYRCKTQLLETRAIAKLFGCSEDEVFLPVDASRKGSTRKVAS